jgi:hypothetical protein
LNRIDSIKFEIHTELITFDSLKYAERTELDQETGEFKKWYILKPKYKQIGLNEITINDKKAIISISSKLIPELYYEMININTIERYLSKILSLNIIQFDINYVIENSQVRTIDTTNNLIVENVKEYISDLSIYKINDKFKFENIKNQTLIFATKKTRNNERIVLYNKYPELMKKDNEEFRKLINIEPFKNIFRIETRLVNFKTIRESFNIPENKIIDILNSTSNVNHNSFCKITDIKNIPVQTFNNYKELIEMRDLKKRSAIEKRIGQYVIADKLNFDIALIRDFINKNCSDKSNNSAIVREYKELIKSYNNQKNNNVVDKKVNQIKEMLLVA